MWGEGDPAAAPALDPIAPDVRERRYGKAVAAAIVVLAVAAGAVWFMNRAAPVPAPQSVVTPPPSQPAAAPRAAIAPPPPQPTTAPVASPAIVPDVPSAAPAAAAAGASGTSFEIVVASFRTETRAASVATQVSAAGLPVQRRAIDGWQQVIAGPFASREEADAAHQRLADAGFGGTHVTSAAR